MYIAAVRSGPAGIVNDVRGDGSAQTSKYSVRAIPSRVAVARPVRLSMQRGSR